MPNCDYEFVYMIENYLYLNFALFFLTLPLLDSPTDLQHNYLDSVLLLSWSQLPLPPQDTCMYEVTLRNIMNESQILQLNTTQTNISISHEQVPSYHDACAFYSWSLVAIVEDKRSPTAQYSKDVSIPLSKLNMSFVFCVHVHAYERIIRVFFYVFVWVCVCMCAFLFKVDLRDFKNSLLRTEL